jgi:hypothetical protein
MNSRVTKSLATCKSAAEGRCGELLVCRCSRVSFTAEQAEIIRKLLGLRKVAPLTEAQRAALHRFSFARDKTPVQSKSSMFQKGAATHTQRPSPMPRDDRRRDHDRMKTSTRRRRG